MNVFRAVTLKVWPNDEAEDNAFKGVLAMFYAGALVMIVCMLAQFVLR